MSSSPTSNKGSTADSSGHNHIGESANQASELRPRPRAGSESSKGPVSKVMEMFRHRSHSAVSAEDKRRAVSTEFIVVAVVVYVLNTEVFCSLMFRRSLYQTAQHMHEYICKHT